MIIKWWSLAHRGLGIKDERLLFHVPNGGKRNFREACRFKAQGVRAGVCDLILLIPRGRYPAMLLELKVGKNKPTAEQRSFMAICAEAGYYVDVSWDWNNATDILKRYCELSRGGSMEEKS